MNMPNYHVERVNHETWNVDGKPFIGVRNVQNQMMVLDEERGFIWDLSIPPLIYGFLNDMKIGEIQEVKYPDDEDD